MWKAYLKADAWVISKTQEAYLWLFDRTGVYVGTLMFASYTFTVALCFIRSGPAWWLFLFLASIGWTSGVRYLWQDKGEHVRYNAVSLMVERATWRYGFNLFMIACVIFDFLGLHFVQGLEETGFLVYSFLLTTKIRDRDKKPFFEKVEKREHANVTI